MSMTNEQYAKAVKALAETPGLGRRRLIRICGCTGYAAETFLNNYHKLKGPVMAVSDTVTEREAPKGVSVREFGKKFDYEAKLRDTIKALCASRFVCDADIREQSEIPATVFRNVASLPEFIKCQIKDGGTIWWSTEVNANEIRAKAGKWGVHK